MFASYAWTSSGRYLVKVEPPPRECGYGYEGTIFGVAWQFFFPSKIFCCVGIKEIVVVVALGQPSAFRVLWKRSGSGNGSGLRSDHVA